MAGSLIVAAGDFGASKVGVDAAAGTGDFGVTKGVGLACGDGEVCAAEEDGLVAAGFCVSRGCTTGCCAKASCTAAKISSAQNILTAICDCGCVKSDTGVRQELMLPAVRIFPPATPVTPRAVDLNSVG